MIKNKLTGKNIQFDFPVQTNWNNSNKPCGAFCVFLLLILTCCAKCNFLLLLTSGTFSSSLLALEVSQAAAAFFLPSSFPLFGLWFHSRFTRMMFWLCLLVGAWRMTCATMPLAGQLHPIVRWQTQSYPHIFIQQTVFSSASITICHSGTRPATASSIELQPFRQFTTLAAPGWVIWLQRCCSLVPLPQIELACCLSYSWTVMCSAWVTPHHDWSPKIAMLQKKTFGLKRVPLLWCYWNMQSTLVASLLVAGYCPSLIATR